MTTARLSRLVVTALVLTRLRGRDLTPVEEASSAADTTEPTKQSRDIASLQGYIGAASVALAVISAVLYIFLRFAYLQFYGRFGLTPEQVGLGRLELLSQALTGPLVLNLLRLRWALLLAAALLILAIAIKSKKVAVDTLIGSLLVFLLTAVLQGRAMVADAISTSREVVNEGLSVEQRLNYVGDLNVPILQIRAQTVQVGWLDKQPPRVLTSRPECLLFLGQSADQVHLYNVFTKATATLPRSRVVLDLRFGTPKLPTSCRPPVPRSVTTN